MTRATFLVRVTLGIFLALNGLMSWAAEQGEPTHQGRIECPSPNPNETRRLTIQIFPKVAEGKRATVNISSYDIAFVKEREPLVGLPVADDYVIQGDNYVIYNNLDNVNFEGKRLSIIRANRRTKTVHVLDTAHTREIVLRNCEWYSEAIRPLETQVWEEE